MKKSLLSTIIFWTLLSLTILWSLKQCGQGRLNEAFADADVGLRSGLSAQQQYLLFNYWELNRISTDFPNARNSAILANYEQLQVKYQSYQIFLDSIRIQLITAAGLRKDSPIATQTLKENRALVKEFLLNGTPNLLTQITVRTDSLRVHMLSLIRDDLLKDANLPLDFSATPDGHYTLNGQTGNFHDLPLAGALAILSNLHISASGSMVYMLNYCMSRSYISCWNFYRFTPAVSPRSSFVWSGSPYVADISLMGYEAIKLYDMKVKINNEYVPVNNSRSHIELSTNKPGKYRLNVEISGKILREEVHDYHLDTFQMTKEFAYHVVSPHLQINRPVHVNYLYANTENPITITAWDDYSADVVRVLSKNASLKHLGGGRYTLTPHSHSQVTLSVGKFATFKCEVRPLPDPVPVFGNYVSGQAVQQNFLGAQKALGARFSADFDFQVDCKILGFHLTRFRGREDPEVIDNQGEQFNAAVHELLKTAQPGDRLLFDEIRVKCGEEPSPRTLAGLSLRVE